jgi:hypothetical protein
MGIGGVAVIPVGDAVAVAIHVVAVGDAVMVLIARAAAGVVVIIVVVEGIGDAVVVAIAPGAAARRLLRLLRADTDVDLGVGCLGRDHGQKRQSRGCSNHDNPE